VPLAKFKQFKSQSSWRNPDCSHTP
jgi:hypothetical protein